MCRHEGVLYLRAAQGHSGKLEPYLNWALVMEVLEPGGEHWIDLAVHGSKHGSLKSILKEGMLTAYSKGETA
eukprot:127524-Alexandrium_andersonii.AAC.1